MTYQYPADPYRFTRHRDGTPTTLAERLNFAPPLRSQIVDRWQTSSLKRRRRRPQAPLPKMLPKGAERDGDFRRRHGIGEEGRKPEGYLRRLGRQLRERVIPRNL